MLTSSVASIACESVNTAMETLGEKVKRLRGRKPMDRIAREAGVTRDVIWRLETGRTPQPRWDTIERLAAVFKMTAEQFLQDTSLIGVASELHAPTYTHADAIHPALFDDNIQPAPSNALPIPEWTAEIACGHWIDCTTGALDPDTQMAIIRAGRFRVRATGDSMLPLYRPGALVQFRIIRIDEEPLILGADYYVQNSDGQCTLKTLESIGEDEYVLAPRNRKYKPLRVAKQMVVRWAIVETIVKAPWEEELERAAAVRAKRSKK